MVHVRVHVEEHDRPASKLALPAARRGSGRPVVGRDLQRGVIAEFQYGLLLDSVGHTEAFRRVPEFCQACPGTLQFELLRGHFTNFTCRWIGSAPRLDHAAQRSANDV